MADIFDQISGADFGDIFDQVASGKAKGKSRNLSRESALAQGAQMTQPEASAYAANRAAFAQEGGVPTFGGAKGGDTRKISYTDSGYRPNEKPRSLRDLAKNAVQNVVELPMAPVQMLSSLANAPDTGKAALDIAKAPLGFVPYVAEPVTGKTALENWGENPVYGALTLTALGKGVKGGANALSESRSIPNAAKLTAKIDEGFTKAVRPSVENNRTATQAAEYKANARNAVKEIVLNKDNLNLADADGNPVKGLPRNLEQFRQSIDSTKRQIWKQVEEVNTAAGETGIEIPLNTAAQELQNLTSNPVYTTMEPGTVAYAKQRALALSKQGAFTIDQAQDAITIANQSLKNFYRNPSADTASRAYVDSLVANHLRAGLDSAIDQATGSSAAGPLRKAYGSLKAIEKDVNQRATVDARKNSRGLIDFTDVFTAGELAKALTSFSPEGLAKAGAMAAVKGFIKHLNNPSTHVRRVFGAADKLVSKTSYTPPKGRPLPAKGIQRPPWEGKVNTGGLTQGPSLVYDPSTGTMISVKQR